MKLRVNEAWNYKAPVLIAIPYLVIYICKFDFLIATSYIFLSLVTIIGIAGYAYLLNDWADEKHDVAAGKPNIVVGLSLQLKILILLLFFAMAVLPWFIFPYNPINILLLGLELFLFYAYAFKPLRLKEKPLGGIVTDALYAHALPCLLAALTFFEIPEMFRSEEAKLSLASAHIALLSIIFSWQFFLGIRNILFHQIEDHANDVLSGAKTFATKLGVQKTEKLLIYFLIPAEVITFFAFIAYMNRFSFFLCGAYLLFAIYTFLTMKIKSLDYRKFSYELFDNFYMDWLPLTILLALVFADWKFIFLFLLHAFLFRNILRNLFERFIIK